MLKLTYLKKKKIKIKKKKNVLNFKLLSLLKQQCLNLKIQKYLNQFFDKHFTVISKNIKSFLTTPSRQLNLKLYNEKSFKRYKKKNFFKDAIYILNIITYCKAPYLFSEFLVNQLAIVKKQWPFIYTCLALLKRFLEIRINIKGFVEKV